VPPTLMWQWVDVRDVAEAHVNALDPAVKGNQRFLLGAGEFTWQKIVDIAKERLSFSTFPEKEVPVGDPNYQLPEERWRFDVSKAEKELKLTWTSLEQSIASLVTQLYNMRSKE